MHGGAADDVAKEGLVRRVTEHYAATLQLRELLHEEDVPALLAYHGAVAKTRRAFVEMTGFDDLKPAYRSEEHKSELQSLTRTQYAVFCLKKKNNKQT